MSRNPHQKKERQGRFLEKMKTDPFLTDEEIADFLDISVPTVRLDRLELGIPELRRRIRAVASQNLDKVRSINTEEIFGELVELELGVSAISVLDATDDMLFSQSHIVRGSCIYAMAESLALAVIDADVALIDVANIKYKRPVHAGDRLLAKATVKESREGKQFIVWIFISSKHIEMFRGKFILTAFQEDGDVVTDSPQ